MFGGFNKTEATPLAEINMIPLVDIMLVLLVIFIITAPVLTHAIKIDMPKANSSLNEEKQETITLSVDAANLFYWNDSLIKESELATRLQDAAKRNPRVELHLRADKKTSYETLAKIMTTARNQGVGRIGFVTEPEKK